MMVVLAFLALFVGLFLIFYILHGGLAPSYFADPLCIRRGKLVDIRALDDGVSARIPLWYPHQGGVTVQYEGCYIWYGTASRQQVREEADIRFLGDIRARWRHFDGQ